MNGSNPLNLSKYFYSFVDLYMRSSIHFVKFHFFSYRYQIEETIVSNAKKWFEDVLAKNAWLVNDVSVFSLLFIMFMKFIVLFN